MTASEKERAGPRLSLIAAVAANRAIGRDGALPWHLPEDLRYFKRLTKGHGMIIGRRTWESIGGPLPWRTVIVVTRREGWEPAPGVHVARSLAEALALAAETLPDDDEVFVGGGTGIFAEALPLADRLYLTEIDADFPGDTFFPEFDRGAWHLVQADRREPTAEVPFGYTFAVYDRVRAA